MLKKVNRAASTGVIQLNVADRLQLRGIFPHAQVWRVSAGYSVIASLLARGCAL